MIAVLAGCFMNSCDSQTVSELATATAGMAGTDEKKSRQIGEAAGTLAQGVYKIDYEEERKLGGGVAIKAFEKFGPYYDDPVMERYVRLVGKAVAEKSDRPALPYAFAIIDNETPNAFAGPGGYIFISIGSLRNMSTEAELAALLAHEVGHVCEKHALSTLQRTKVLQGLAKGTSIADPENAEDYNKAVSQINDVLFEKGLDQEMEYEADLLGVEYAARTGYHPWGMRDFLLNLKNLSGESGGWFQTHPGLDQRISRLNAYLNQNYADFQNLPKVTDRYQQMVTNRLKPKQDKMVPLGSAQ
ncbi:MAG: M48 family metalloprotease [bacterium]